MVTLHSSTMYSQTSTQSQTQDVQPEYRCFCGLLSYKCKSRSVLNPGREFYPCPKPREDTTRCKYFVWVTPEVPPSLPSPPATPSSSQAPLAPTPSQARRASMARGETNFPPPAPGSSVPSTPAKPSRLSAIPPSLQMPGSGTREPRTPSKNFTPEQKAKRLNDILQGLKSGGESEPPPPPSSPFTPHSGASTKEGGTERTASAKRFAAIKDNLPPQGTKADQPDQRPLSGIDSELRQARTPSASTRKSHPSSSLKRSFAEVINVSDDEDERTIEENFFTAESGSEGSRPRKTPRSSPQAEEPQRSSASIIVVSDDEDENNTAPTASPATKTPSKGKGRASAMPPMPISTHSKLKSDPENPFEIHDEQVPTFSTGSGSSTPSTPSSSRHADELRQAAQVLLQSASHLEKLERKKRCDDKSIKKKLESIAAMQERNNQLEAENTALKAHVAKLQKSERDLKDIVEGLHVDRP